MGKTPASESERDPVVMTVLGPRVRAADRIAAYPPTRSNRKLAEDTCGLRREQGDARTISKAAY